MIVPLGVVGGCGHPAILTSSALIGFLHYYAQTWIHTHRLFFLYRSAITAGLAVVFSLCGAQVWRARHWVHYELPSVAHRIGAGLSFTAFRLVWHPIMSVNEGTVFAAPGFLNFQGGLFNPGAIVHNGGIIVCAKSQEMHWQDAIRSKRFDCYMRGKPVLMELDSDLRIQSSTVVPRINNLPEDNDIGVEDFRLFEFDRQIYLNHSMCHKEASGGYERAEQCLSFLDMEKREITYLGQPKVDFEISPMEKNWSYFEHNGELYMLFSFSPYVLLKAANWPDLSFETVLRRDVDTAPFHSGFFPNFLSLSTNPIDYDSNHLLVLVHRFVIVEHRMYAHWAVLIDKESLLPVKVSSRPIVCGGKARGVLPGIIYTTAVINVGDSLIVFSGESDLLCSYAKIDRKRLDDCWTPLQVRADS